MFKEMIGVKNKKSTGMDHGGKKDSGSPSKTIKQRSG